ncbi:MAG: helix-turn-helix transcriptional regulator [Bryobacteraceae bacterium]
MIPLYYARFSKYQGVATLAVDRLISISLSSVTFTADAAFDPKQCRDQAFGVSWQDPEQIVLHFRADQAPYIRERTWHPTQQIRPLPSGGVEMIFHAGGRFEIRRWILGWGDAVEVIAPESLRKDLIRVSESTLRQYAGRKEEN